MQCKVISKTKESFLSCFGEAPEKMYSAPGRINIIGEHVDYNDGYVLPAAIDKSISFAVTKLDNSTTCKIFAIDLDEEFTLDLNQNYKPVSQTWMNYLLGVLQELKNQGKEIGGFQMAFSSTIPMGSGLSSSAALECGFAFILNDLFDLNLSKEDIAVIGQKSENNFVGVNCGIMDQFASVFGKDEKVILLDCNDLSYSYYDAHLEGYSWVLFNSCVKHTHLTSGYNDRRSDVEQGKIMIKNKFPEVENFRQVTKEMLDELLPELGEVIYRRCLFVVNEIRRVQDAVKAFSDNDFEKLGNLLTETHYGLSKNYEVSCEECDYLVDIALQLDGVAGARMMGGGFGGCTINLVKTENVENVIAKVKEQYLEKYQIETIVYEVKISEGVCKIEE